MDATPTSEPQPLPRPLSSVSDNSAYESAQEEFFIDATNEASNSEAATTAEHQYVLEVGKRQTIILTSHSEIDFRQLSHICTDGSSTRDDCSPPLTTTRSLNASRSSDVGLNCLGASPKRVPTPTDQLLSPSSASDGAPRARRSARQSLYVPSPKENNKRMSGVDWKAFSPSIAVTPAKSDSLSQEGPGSSPARGTPTPVQLSSSSSGLSPSSEDQNSARNSNRFSYYAPPSPSKRASPVYPQRIYFYRREDPYYGFTNFSPHPVEHNGRVYPTSEHLFQSFKFQEHRPLLAEHIRLFSDRPSVALSEARRFQPEVRKDWMALNKEKMDETLWHKFNQHADLKAELLATGNAILIEDSDKDSFWGVGPDRKGKNELGKALERLRSRLRSEDMNGAG